MCPPQGAIRRSTDIFEVVRSPGREPRRGSADFSNHCRQGTGKMSDEREGDELLKKLKELAEKKESEPPPELTKDVVINLAGMTPLQYAQQLGREAKKY